MLYRPWPLRLAPRYQRLMRDGVRASAVVVRSEAWGWVVGPGRPNRKLRLKVYYDDGATTEIDRVEHIAVLGTQHVVGSTLPMRHDAVDRGYVEIDRAESQRREEVRRARHERSQVRAAEARMERARKPRRDPGA